MARQYKKILKKIQPKDKDKKPKEKPEKIGKDYVLIIVLTVTILFMAIGWSYFTYINRGLYVALTASLLATYIRRHVKLTEKQDYWVEKASQVAMGVAIVLFGIVAYQQYFSE